MYVIENNAMPTWKKFCEEFADYLDVKLLFVTKHGLMIELPDGTAAPILIDELMDILNAKK